METTILISLIGIVLGAIIAWLIYEVYTAPLIETERFTRVILVNDETEKEEKNEA
jgi:uncharacterized membrane protein YdjX (TVP38/TMEM64 family)